MTISAPVQSGDDDSSESVTELFEMEESIVSKSESGHLPMGVLTPFMITMFGEDSHIIVAAKSPLLSGIQLRTSVNPEITGSVPVPYAPIVKGLSGIPDFDIFRVP